MFGQLKPDKRDKQIKEIKYFIKIYSLFNIRNDSY